MALLRPALDLEPAWQVLVVARGATVRNSVEPLLRAALMRGVHAILASREASLVDGWLVHARTRAGVTVMIAARPGREARAVPSYLDALLDAYTPVALEPFVPPDSRGGPGGSGAPALIASYTPPRGAC